MGEQVDPSEIEISSGHFIPNDLSPFYNESESVSSYKTFVTKGEGGMQDMVRIFPEIVQSMGEDTDEFAIKLLPDCRVNEVLDSKAWSTELYEDELGNSFVMVVVLQEGEVGLGMRKGYHIELQCIAAKLNNSFIFPRIGISLGYANNGDFLIETIYSSAELQTKGSRDRDGTDIISGKEIQDFMKNNSLISDFDNISIFKEGGEVVKMFISLQEQDL